MAETDWAAFTGQAEQLIDVNRKAVPEAVTEAFADLPHRPSRPARSIQDQGVDHAWHR